MATTSCLAFFAHPATDQSLTWSNASTDFNAGASWVSGSAPTTANTAFFNSPGKLVQPTLTADITVLALRFTSAGWTLSSSGGTVTVLSTGQALFLNTGTAGATAAINTNVVFGAASNATQQAHLPPTRC
ncbi:MAG: hypothetical protein H7343_17715 [Undibacterium sp.]|nr:hypothetical protein [Opitutaceae bacterium]